MEILTPEGAVVEPVEQALWAEPERRRVVRLCALLAGDAAVAEDLAQETLLEAWRIRHRLVDPAGASAWVDAVARNVCRRWRAQRARLRGHEVTAASPDELAPDDEPRDELADLLEQEELAELLDRALGLLPAQTREALVARYVDELGPREIGRRLGVAPDAVSMRLTRGRARIRELLETDLADEPLAEAWVARHGVAWRSTRLGCPTCGRTVTSMRRDERAGVVELRCDGCEPLSLGSVWRIDNPVLRPHLTAVRRPSAVVSRMAAWSHAWWPAAIESGRVPCTRCGSRVEITAYERTDVAEPRVRRGWLAACGACGEALSTSLLGLTLCLPEVRGLRARRPRAHAVPTRTAERAGRPVLVVGLADDSSGDRVEVLFDDATTRPVAVVASR